MRSSTKHLLRLTVCAAGLLAGFAAPAQSSLPGGPSTGSSTVLTKFFGGNPTVIEVAG